MQNTRRLSTVLLLYPDGTGLQMQEANNNITAEICIVLMAYK